MNLSIYMRIIRHEDDFIDNGILEIIEIYSQFPDLQKITFEQYPEANCFRENFYR